MEFLFFEASKEEIVFRRFRKSTANYIKTNL